MKKTIVPVLVGACLLAGGAAHAAQGRGAGALLMKADANQDGVITRDEMLAAERTRFAGLDADKDGKLSAAEREKAAGRRGGRGGAMLGRADTDGDSFVSRAEFEAAAMKRFGMLDGNGDGRIDAAERNAMMEKMRAMRGFGGR